MDGGGRKILLLVIRNHSEGKVRNEQILLPKAFVTRSRRMVEMLETLTSLPATIWDIISLIGIRLTD